MSSIKRFFFGFSLLTLLSGINLHAKKTSLKSDELTSQQFGKISYYQFEVLFKKGSETEDAYTRFKKMEAIRSQAQSSLERLMKQSSNPELAARYAELTIQRGRDQESFGLELEMSGSASEAKKLRDSSKVLLRSGLVMHEKNIKALKNETLKAEVYLGMSRTERSLGSNQRAMHFASKGLELSSKISSQTRMRLHMAMGDAAFEMAKADPALKSYRSALQLAPDTGLERSYLEYKIAWSLYNLKDPVNAVKSLRKLIDNNQDRFALKQEAIRDYGLMASDLSKAELEDEGGVKGVYKYLRKSSDSDLPERAIERLAKTFAANGRRQDAADAMLMLIEEKPKDKSNVDRALLIVEWEKDLVEKWKLRDRYMWILTSFGPSSDWFRGLEHDAQMLARKKIESSIRNYATSLHKEAQLDGNKESRDEKLMIVARLYDAHIKEFFEEPRIYFYRAEIHTHFSEWPEAGEAYSKYLAQLKLLPQDELSAFDKKTKAEVLESHVEVWEKATKSNPQYSDKLLAAADLFVEQNSKDPRSAKVLFSAAESAFLSKNSAAAMSRLERVVREYPKSQTAVDAVDAALDMYNKENDWVNLAIKARAWLDAVQVWAPESQISKSKKELEGILAKTELKACEELSKKSDRLLESALCFESFAKGFPGDSFAPKALFQAAEIYQKTKRSTAELDVLEDLVKKYPKSVEAEKAFGTLATVYEKNFLFDRATEIYEVLVSRPNLKDRAIFIERLLVLLQGTGQREKLQKWLKDPLVTATLRKQILSEDYKEMFAKLREDEISDGYVKGDFTKAESREIFARLSQAQKNNELEFYQVLEMQRFKGNLLKEKGKLGEADKEWMEGLKAFWAKKSRSDLEWESAARLRLDQSAFWLVPFEATHLKQNPQKKVELFTKLEAWYAEVIGMKSPTVALEALWRSSKLYASFSKELATLPETKVQSEELARKSKLALEQLASRARDWKLMSPAILAAISSMQDSAEPTKTKNEFPWPSLPLWFDASSEWLSWEEWKFSRSELTNLITKSSDRKSLRRSAMVLAVRDGIDSDPATKTWLSTLGDKPSIQVRIQILLNSKSLQLANLYLDQYQEVFGKDAFVSYMAGHVMWARGDYRSAYDYWVKKNSAEDFHSLYWKMGWDYAFANLGSAEQRPLASSYYQKLKSRSDEPWKKVYLYALCLNSKIDCKSETSTDVFVKLFDEDLGPQRSWQSKFGGSVFDVKRLAIETFVESGVPQVKELAALKPYKEALSSLWSMGSFATDRSAINDTHQRHKNMIDKRQFEIEQKLKNDLIVTTSKTGASL